MQKVAIIGCGYSGTVVLHRLKNRNPHVPVDVFDSAGVTGYGLAYQPDISSNLINRPAKLMWFDEPGDFSRWLRDKPSRKRAYQPRALFGQFINSKLERLIADSTNLKIHTQPVLAINEVKPKRYLITTSEGVHGPYTAVILATGNPEPRDAYHLSGKNNYYNSAYPTVRLLDIRSKDIGVIGNQLSAIDTSIALLERHPENRVTLLSRRSKLPNHSEHYQTCQLNIINEEHLAKTISLDGLSLTAIRHMFDAELTSQGIHITFKELMADHSKVEIARQKIYSILSTTNLLMPKLWSQLSEREKHIFSQRYARNWRQLRVPIPKENRNKIDHYIKDGRLRLRPGLRSITPYISGTFKAQGSDYEETFTHIINATGAGNSMDTPLYRNMAKHGLCQPNKYGGLKVCLDDCRIIGIRSVHNIFAIGTPTTGDFFSTSNIDILQMQAEIITKTITSK